MIKNIYYILLLIFLAACSNTSRDHSKLIKNIDKQLWINNNISNGHIVASYNLARIHKNDCIHAKDYGSVINNEPPNNLFIKKIKQKKLTTNFIHKEAERKIKLIKDLMIKLDTKYRFLSHLESRLFKHSYASTKGHDYYKELLYLDKILTHIPIMLPNSSSTVTSHYGLRRHPCKKNVRMHFGIDLVNQKSTPIYSSAMGIVTKAEKTNGYGNMVEVKHSQSFTTIYAHLKKIDVHKGDRVLKGQQLGIQGNSGNATKEHLHFEIKLDGKTVDPFDFIAHACKC